MERRRFRSDELRAARASRFAAQLADSLYALGLTHKDLAHGLEVALSTVDSWTRGADPKIPSEATFVRLCAWLDAQAPGTGHTLALAAGRTWTPPAVEPAATEAPAPLLLFPVESPARPPTNLPLPLTSFVGRERELAEIPRLVGTARLLTLTGAGGIGKTRLALQVAGASAGAFPDGVWLVELGALTDAERVPQAVATALGVREQPGEALTTTLGEYLRARHLLLVLDNCEHLVGASAALCGALLQRSSRLTILATSQEALRVPGEVTWQVLPLTVPPGAPADVAQLLACEAGRLFVERAQLSRPDFALTAANVEAVTQVCTRLDGVPLALELAAACLQVLTLPQLAARLDDRFRLLTAGNRLAMPRQQTLRATLDWSYELLTVPERALFARLAVFAGGWALDAAEAVCGPDLPSDGEVLPLLTQLVAKSLGKVEVGDADARYTFLETIRTYAVERLTASEEVAALRERHARYYQQLAEAGEAHLTGPQQGFWLDRLEAEHDNLRAALRWSQATPTGGGVGLGLVGALSRFWSLRGYLGEGRDWVAGVLRHPGALARTAARARALFGAGRLAHVQGDLGTARLPLEESAAIWRELGEAQQLANAQTLLGLVLAGLGEAGAAQAVLQESVALLRLGGDGWALARALFCLGEVAANEEDFATATALLDESLGLFRQVGDQAFIANTLMALGELAREQGDLAAAARLGAESLALYQAQGFTSGIAYTLKDLGDVAWAQGEIATARAHFAESLRLCRDLDDQEGIATGLLHLGQIAHAEGDLPPAQALLTEGVLLKRRLGHKPGLAQALLSLGWVTLDQGAVGAAAACFRESLALAQELGSVRGRADGLLGLAAVALAVGAADAAAQLLGVIAAVPGSGAAAGPRGQAGRADQVLAAVRSALAAPAFAAAWAAGQAQPLDAACAAALAAGWLP